MPFKPEAQKSEIHRLATKAKIPWDDNPKFKRWSKQLTGTSHLDKMTPAQLAKMKSAISERSKIKVAVSLSQLRTATKHLKRFVVKPKSLYREAVSRYQHGGSNYPKPQKAPYETNASVRPIVTAGKGKGTTTRNAITMRGQHPVGRGRRGTQATHALSGRHKEILNRSIRLHEGREVRGLRGSPKAWNMSSNSHINLEPPLQDLNIAATLKRKDWPAAAAIRRSSRKDLDDITDIIPDVHRLNLGRQRLSRHAIKRINQLYTDQVGMAPHWKDSTKQFAKNPMVKISKVLGHVEQRAQQRSKITPEEIKRLRKSLLKMRLRKGMTYYYTWPGRGHAIIGDVGKKMPKHVVKTIYKSTDTPPGHRITKLAGGGARTMKSLRRVIQRMSQGIAGKTGESHKKVFRDLLDKTTKSGIHHSFGSPYGASLLPTAYRKGLRGVPKGGVTHFTTGGVWPQDYKATHSIPFGDIRKMRGKFGIDTLAAEMPLRRNRSNALVFKGNLRNPTIRTKFFESMLKKRGLPRELLYHAPSLNMDRQIQAAQGGRYPSAFGGSSLGYPRGDANIQMSWVKRRVPKRNWSAEQRHLDSATRRLHTQWGDERRNVFKPLKSLPPMSQWTPEQKAARMKHLLNLRAQRVG